MIGIQDSGQKIIGNGLVINMDFSQLRTYPESGTVITDLSSNAFTGTMVNTVGYTNTAPKSFNYTNGSGNYFVGNSNLNTVITAGITVISWVRVTNILVRSLVFSKYLTTLPAGYSFEIGTASGSWTNTLRFFTQGTSSTSSIDYRGATGAISQNTNVMVTATFDFATKTTALYVNGSVISGTQTGGSPSSLSSDWYAANNNFRIGSLRPQFSIDAAMNQYSLFVYNRALTAAEIQNNYNATKSRFGL
jgi:hypothetical protein